VTAKWSRRRTIIALAVAGWAVAGLVAWLFVSVVGWFGILVIGVAILMVASLWRLDDQNALPSNAMGSSHLYAAQYERQFSRSPEESAAKHEAEDEFNRVLYVVRTIGIAMVLLGLNTFIIHQL
jgi:hypothetical protein